MQGLPGSRVVDPASPFAAGMEVVSGALLLYSLAVIPLQLSLWEGQQDSSDRCVHIPTLEFDMFADLFFPVEILLNFATCIVEGVNYCYELLVIAVAYVRLLVRRRDVDSVSVVRLVDPAALPNRNAPPPSGPRTSTSRAP